MIYLTPAEELEWFAGPASCTVRSAGFCVSSPPPEALETVELLEVLGNCTYSETGDFEFTTRTIYALARRLGIGEEDINLSIADNYEIWNTYKET